MAQIPFFAANPDHTPMEAEGFRDFQLFAMLSRSANLEWQRGWWLAWARCYGQGVKVASHNRHDAVPIIDNPYPQFSPPWEAWASGFDAEEHL